MCVCVFIVFSFLEPKEYMAYAKTEDLKKNWMEEIQVARCVHVSAFRALLISFSIIIRDVICPKEGRRGRLCY